MQEQSGAGSACLWSITFWRHCFAAGRCPCCWLSATTFTPFPAHIRHAFLSICPGQQAGQCEGQPAEAGQISDGSRRFITQHPAGNFPADRCQEMAVYRRDGFLWECSIWNDKWGIPQSSKKRFWPKGITSTMVLGLCCWSSRLFICRNLGYQGGLNPPREQVNAEMGITGVEETPSLETLKAQLGEVLGNLI